MSVYLDIKSLYPHLKVNWNILTCKICIARRLVVAIFLWCMRILCLSLAGRCWRAECETGELQMLLFPNAFEICCSLYERNCICTVTKIFKNFLPASNFCQLLRVMGKRSCTSAGNAQAQLHFRDDQQRAFGISNISNWGYLGFPASKNN